MTEQQRFSFLDRQSEIDTSARCMPHWFQPGVATFVTIRTLDSMPSEAISVWRAKQFEFLKTYGFGGMPLDVARTQLLGNARQEFENFRHRVYSELLDASYGECLLRDSRLSSIVAERLLHFNEVRYDLDRFVVMPNHVHLLVAFRAEFKPRIELRLFMQYTARRIHETLGRQGAFWQPEPFDHCIRSEAHFEATRLYIRNNPIKARLKPGSYLYWQS